MSNGINVSEKSSNRHLRTIGKTAEWLQIIDNETPIKYSTIRSAILRGELNCVNVGSKRLVILEEVYKHFYGTEIDPDTVSKTMKA